METVKIGIVGFGFMGQTHFRSYTTCKGAKVVAICDADEEKLKASAGTAGNITDNEDDIDLTGIGLFSDFDKMLAEAGLDAVSITLPTYMHRDFTVKALEAGLNVLCEKPMAPEIKQCEDMIAASERTGKVLQVAHCIRFWPEYAKTKEIIDSGRYGKVLAASFRRLSSRPTWSWGNWITNPDKSGGMLIDLHIHDSDFVQYLFGMPKAVRANAVKTPGTNDLGHAVTTYMYDDDKVIVAEGGWIMTPGFGFEMSFNIMLEKATVIFDCTRKPAFMLFPDSGQGFTPEVLPGDGYTREIEYFIKTVAGDKTPETITPRQSLDTIKIVLAEKRSVETGKDIAL